MSMELKREKFLEGLETRRRIYKSRADFYGFGHEEGMAAHRLETLCEDVQQKVKDSAPGEFSFLEELAADYEARIAQGDESDRTRDFAALFRWGAERLK